jgi:hypothetical protein
MSDEDENRGGGLILSSLVDNPLVPSGSALLSKAYGITNLDNPSRWTMSDWEELGERGRQMDWLEAHLPKIKARFKQVIQGQVSWEKLKCELIAEGFKGAADVKKSTVDALIAEARYNSKIVPEQDHRLTAFTKQFREEAKATNDHTDQLCGFTIAALRARYQQQIDQKMQEDPEFAANLAAWDAARKSEYEMASVLLEYGSAGRSHPKFQQAQRTLEAASAQQASFGGGSAQQQRRYADELNINLKGNVAGVVNRFASRAGAGARKLKNFFFGGE